MAFSKKYWIPSPRQPRIGNSIASLRPSIRGKEPADMLAHGEWLEDKLLAPLPHPQYVFALPMLIRPFFRYRRRFFGELCRLIAWLLKTGMLPADRSALVPGRPGVMPGPTGIPARPGYRTELETQGTEFDQADMSPDSKPSSKMIVSAAPLTPVKSPSPRNKLPHARRC